MAQASLLHSDLLSVFITVTVVTNDWFCYDYSDGGSRASIDMPVVIHWWCSHYHWPLTLTYWYYWHYDWCQCGILPTVRVSYWWWTTVLSCHWWCHSVHFIDRDYSLMPTGRYNCSVTVTTAVLLFDAVYWQRSTYWPVFDDLPVFRDLISMFHWFCSLTPC